MAHTPKRDLETPRLWLRPMQPADTEPLLAIFADARVMAAFATAPFDRAQMQQWVDHNLAHQATHGYGPFSVFLKTNGLLIGDCCLELMEVDGRVVAELGYDVRSDYWNQGYARLSLRIPLGLHTPRLDHIDHVFYTQHVNPTCRVVRN